MLTKQIIITYNYMISILKTDGGNEIIKYFGLHLINLNCIGNHMNRAFSLFPVSFSGLI